MGFPGGTVVENLPANAGDLGLIPGSGKPTGGGNGTPLQYSCLKNSMDRGLWQAIVHGVTKRWTWLNNSVAAASINIPFPRHGNGACMAFNLRLVYQKVYVCDHYMYRALLWASLHDFISHTHKEHIAFNLSDPQYIDRWLIQTWASSLHLTLFFSTCVTSAPAPCQPHLVTCHHPELFHF